MLKINQSPLESPILAISEIFKKSDNINMDFLSMGMSEDYNEAILSGANMIRVGSGLFGARIYR